MLVQELNRRIFKGMRGCAVGDSVRISVLCTMDVGLSSYLSFSHILSLIFAFLVVYAAYIYTIPHLRYERYTLEQFTDRTSALSSFPVHYWILFIPPRFFVRSALSLQYGWSESAVRSHSVCFVPDLRLFKASAAHALFPAKFWKCLVNVSQEFEACSSNDDQWQRIRKGRPHQRLL